MDTIQALAKLMHAKTGVDLQAGDKVSLPLAHARAFSIQLENHQQR